MKKISMVLVLALLASVASFAQDDGTTAPNAEIALNVFGLFTGSYTARVEVPLISDGLVSAGLRGTYVSQEVGDLELSGVQALLEARMYPSAQIRGFYVLVEGGYTSRTVSDSNEEITLTSLPVLGGLGWKWVISKVSIDLGLAYGKQVYIDQPDTDMIDFNKFPWNTAFDGYLLVGFRL